MIASETKTDNGWLGDRWEEVRQPALQSGAVPGVLQAARTSLEGTARQHPMVVVTVAAIVGLTAGWLIKRR